MERQGTNKTYETSFQSLSTAIEALIQDSRMAKYFMNANAHANGDHYLHREGCPHLPEEHNLKSIGMYITGFAALVDARKLDAKIELCLRCSDSSRRSRLLL